MLVPGSLMPCHQPRATDGSARIPATCRSGISRELFSAQSWSAPRTCNSRLPLAMDRSTIQVRIQCSRRGERLSRQETLNQPGHGGDTVLKGRPCPHKPDTLGLRDSPRDYSLRRVTMGSTWVARRAGIYDAVMAIAAKKVAMAAKTIQSPKSMP